MIDPENIQVVNNPADVEKLMNPVAEFDTTLEMIEADKKAKMQAELDRIREEKAKPPSAALAEAGYTSPLVLEYRFTGQDPSGHEVTTIVLETPAGIYANAFCVQENKQILTIKVEPIPKHTQEKTIGDTMKKK